MTVMTETHGFREVTWQGLDLPARFWQAVEQTPDGCWLFTKNGVTREYVVVRLLGCKWTDVYSATPTCGTLKCVNPAHTCVVMKQPASEEGTQS